MNRSSQSKAVLFVTCLGDTFYPEAPAAVCRVLERLGMEVGCPLDQTCCGQPMFNAGYMNQARSVARRFVEIFSRTEGPIVVPSSSCAAMVREHYPALFKEEPETLARAQEVGERTFEFCQFLTRELEVDPAQQGARFEGSVTFHRSCHFRALGLKEEPENLIRGIPGIDYIPLPRMEECCGFGGTFSLNFPHVSREMVKNKVEAIKETGAQWLIFADPGCAMNITGYANRAGKPIKAMHVAELLDKAMED